MHYALAPGIELRSGGSEGGLLLDLRKGLCFRLNATGVHVVESLVRGEDSRAATLRLAESARIPESRAAADVESLLKDLLGQGLIRTGPA